MKRLLIYALLLTVFFFAPKQVLAQPISDEFVCVWTGIECIADRTLSRCPTGTDFSDASCRDSTNEFDCNTSGTFQCVEVEIETDYWQYESNAGECIPSSNPPYTTKEACELARARASKCDTRTYECVECDPQTDDECTQTLAQCNSICKAPKNPAAQVAAGCSAGEGRVNTAIGCIPFDLINTMTRFFLSWSLSIGGGVSLLLVGISALMFATSSGIPEKVNNAKSLFWAAISGIILILLSVFLLRIIGVDILGLFA